MFLSIKRVFNVFIVGCVIYVGIKIFEGGFNYETTEGFLIDFGFKQMYTFVLGFINMYLFEFIKTRKWENNDTLKRIIYGIIGYSLVTLVCLFLLRVVIIVLVYRKPFAKFLEDETIANYKYGFGITLIVVAFFYIIYFYNQYQKTKLKEQKVIAGAASAKFDALKNQLDPHFLFNSLNVLTSLIDENPDNAQKFTTSLSKVYRYVLEQKNKELVTVDEELDFAKTYMSLLKMRFEDSIIFDIPEHALNPESKVVPLSLQLLLENAVKHNMVTANKPLHIKIYESGGDLVIENNLQPKQIVKKSSGVGLENIKQRYQLLTKKQVKIKQQAKRFAVAIPMLTKQVSIMKSIEENTSQFDDNYVRARNHVEELKGFYYSLISYMLVIPFLAFINYRTSWNFQWFWFPMLGWGIGLVFQAYNVFVNDGILGRNWERKKIEQFMREEEEQDIDSWD